MAEARETADEIVGTFLQKLERGERADPDEVVRAHPELADELRERLAVLVQLDATFGPRAAPTDDVASLVGRRLGPYRIESLLGAGGMGTVYLATAETPGASADEPSRVAVKVIHPRFLARPGGAERFVREAELGRRVRHANVVRTLDAGEAAVDGASLRFLVMEHVEGRTLRDLADELGHVSEQLCRHVGREIARGLAALHAAGAVHRDLKPENVLITRDHVVKVMDLGVARLKDDVVRLSQTGTFVGSLLYGAPEQFGLPRAAGAQEAAPRSPARAKGGDPVDHRCDLHALGLVLYELAAGVHPFAGDDFHEVVRRVLDERPKRLGLVNPQVSPLFEELVAQLLEKDPDRRPATAADVARILDEGEGSAWWRERSVAIRRETRRPLRRIRIPRETAVYGREADLATLRALFEKTKAGDGQVVLVEGEAGIGKSRLVDEFVMSLWAGGEDIDFLFGSYPPGGAATASGAFSTAYRAHLGDDEAAIREALPQTPLLVPAFVALLRGDAPPEGASNLTKDSLQTLFVRATQSFAARRTTIVFIDDLHFAPEEGRALFASLALAVPGHRILLVGGARRSLDEKWAAGVARLPHASRLALERLGAKDLVDLLDDALRSRHLAEELGAKIATKSDGNPFFVFEILRGLREGQFLTRKPDGTWITTRVIRDIEIPPSIVEVIQARVSDLGKAERDVLEVAACVGFEFDAGIVGAVLRVEPIPLLQTLGEIEKRRRLVRSVGRQFAFDHHQVQEVLYAGLSAPLREAYHAAIGDAVEVRSGAAPKEPKDVDGAVCVELAEHFVKGAQGPRALRYLGAALTHLEKRYLNDQTVALADRALAAPGLLAGKARVQMLLRETRPLHRLGRRDAELAVLEEALELADATEDAGLRARVRLMRGQAFSALSRHDEAEASLRSAHDLARTAGDRKLESAASLHLGDVFQHLGRYADALAVTERSLALAREIGDRTSESGATLILGNVCSTLGRIGDALTHYERLLALARDIGDRGNEARAWANLGIVLTDVGRYAESQAAHERALALAREVGERAGEVIITNSLGLTFRGLGHVAEALTLHERSLALSREIGDRMTEAAALTNLGSLRLELGDPAGARRDFLASLALSREIGARYAEGYAVLGLSSLAEEEGDTAGALRLSEEALALRRAIGHGDGVAWTLVTVSEQRRQTGDAAGARAALDEALTLAQSQHDKSLSAVALALLANFHGGDAKAAETALDQAGDALKQTDAARVRWLLWQATRDRTHLAEAKRILDFIVEHAPPESREPMLANVRLHREIAAAAKAAGL